MTVITPRTVTLSGDRQTTVQLGQEEPVSSVSVDTIPVAAPLFVLGAAGSPARTQLIGYRANGRTWTYALRSLFRLQTVLLSNHNPSLILQSGDFAAENVVQTATTFSVTYTGYGAISGDVSQVVINGAVDSATGALKFTWSVALDANAGKLGTLVSVGWLECPDFSVVPYEIPTRSEMYMVSPIAGGMVVPNVTVDQGADQFLPYPDVNLGYPDAAVTEPPGSRPLYAQYCALWHKRTRSLLYFEIRDLNFTHKQIRWNGNPTSQTTDVGVRQFPIDNLAITTVSSAYEVWMIPMVGEPWDCADTYRKHFEALSPVWLSRGKLKNQNLALDTTVSDYVYNAHLLYIYSLPASDPMSVTNIREEALRLRNFFGPNANIIGLCYEWHFNDFAGPWPDVDPIRNPINDTVLYLRDDLNIPTCFYQIVIWGVSSKFITKEITQDSQGWQTAFGNPIGYVVHDKDGANAVAIKDGGHLSPTDPLRNHYIPNPIHTNMRLHEVERFARFPSFGAIHHLGYYLDGYLNGGLIFDYRATLASNLKGPGSGACYLGRRQLVLDMALGYRPSLPDFMLISEHPGEGNIDVIDMSATVNIDLFSITARHIALRHTTYGQYTRSFSFDSFGTFPASIGVDYYEPLYVNQALMFIQGTIIGVQTNATSRLIISGPGDVDVSPAQDPYMAFNKLLLEYVRNTNIMAYYRGVKLRSPTGTLERHVMEDGWDWGLTGDSAFFRPISPTTTFLAVGVFTHEEEAQQPIGLLVVNPFNQTNTWEVRMDGTQFPFNRNGTMKRLLVERVGSTRTIIRDFVGFLSTTITLAPHEVRMYEVLENL